MRSLYWTKRTPLNKANLDIMVGNDVENYLTVTGSPQPPIAFRHSDTGYEFTGSNIKWHVIKDLTIKDLQLTDSGVYRISAWQSVVSQVHSNIAKAEPYWGFWDYGSIGATHQCVEGWEVGLRMDRNVILVSQTYAQSGHLPSAFPEALLRTYRPEIHTFEVVLRPFLDGYKGAFTGYQISNTGCHVVWGNPNDYGGTNANLTSYHMVQYIGS